MVDFRLVFDFASIILAVYTAYVATMRRIEKRLQNVEVQLAIILDRDRRKRLEDYAKEEKSDDGQ